MKLSRRNISLAPIALSVLLLATLCPTSAQASWNPVKCKALCTQKGCAKNSKTLNECATHCNHPSIMNCILPNCTQLTPENKDRFEGLLRSKQKAVKEEQNKIEEQMKVTKNKIKMKYLDNKQNKLIAEINDLGEKIQKCGEENIDVEKLSKFLNATSREEPHHPKQEAEKPAEGTGHHNPSIPTPPALPEYKATTPPPPSSLNEEKKAPPPPSQSQDLLAQIQKGKQLKKAETGAHKQDPSTASEGSLHNALANALKNRRGALHEDENHHNGDFEENNFD